MKPQQNSTNTTIVVTFFDPPFNVIHKTFLKSGSTVRFVLIVSVFEPSLLNVSRQNQD